MRVTHFNRILIVEDDLDLLENLRETFSEYFHDVVAACDGASAYLAIRDEKFDLILSDIRMPGFNGIELVTRLRAEGNTVPVILTSGVVEREDLTRALRLGVRDFVAKPYRMDNLLATTYSVIEVHKREKKIGTLLKNFDDNDHQIKHQQKMIGLLQAAQASKKSA